MTWLVTHRVAEQSAKRDAYARYLAALDEYGMQLLRRVDSARDRASGFADMPPDGADRQTNAALAALLILAPTPTAETIDRLQRLMAELAVLAIRVPAGGYPEKHSWHRRSRDFLAMRRDLIQAARRETGADPLPAEMLEPDA